MTDRLRLAREAKNLTQADVARAISVSRNLVSRWEIGDRKPQGDELVKLADLFQVTTDYLLGRSDALASAQAPVAPAAPASEPDRLMRVAEELSAALKMREENERLRIQQVDSVRAEAERTAREADRIAQENLRMLMLQLMSAPRGGSQSGGGEPVDEAASASDDQVDAAQG